MDYYLDLTLLPDEEVPIYFLRNKTYTKLHKAIHNLKATNIGISFPQANVNKLGGVIRLHSTQTRLQELQNLNCLGNLIGYCKISHILPVPNKVEGYRTISRIRQTMSNAKLRRTVAFKQAQKELSEAQANQYIQQYKAKMFATGLDSPYLELQSTSTSNKYRLYIAFGDLQKQPIDGKFNRFGLSKTATISIF